MAQANWGHDDPRVGFHDQYDQGYAPTHHAPRQQGYAPQPSAPHHHAPQPHVQHQPRYEQSYQPQYAEPPVMRSSYVHPAHGGPAPQPQPQPHVQPQWQQQAYGEAPMAAMEQGGYEPAPLETAPSRVGGVMNYAGAALSLALIVGLAVWGYKLAVRDVTGIPVVRALEGPMRVQPDNPGGQSAAHQGLAVNTVQAAGEASAPAERLVLAPAPEDLTDEDMVTEVAATVPLEMRAPTPSEPVLATPEEIPADPVAAALALAEQLSQGAEQLSGETLNEEVVASIAGAVVQEAAPVETVAVIPASVPGVKMSPRPAGRPADLETRVAAAVAEAPVAVTAVTDVSADKIPAGTRLVQLGAFDSADVAKAEWEKLSTRFEDYLAGKSRVIQQAQSGGKTFYRLRAMGFSDLADARRFCSVLMAAKAACIPVVTR